MKLIQIAKAPFTTRALQLLSLIAALGVTSGCRNNGGGNVYREPWYDVYGRVCGYNVPTAGCNFYADGSKIFATEDPRYSDAAWDANVTYGDWTYYDSYGVYSLYTGWGWLSSTGILYDEFGYALNEGDEGESRDLIAQAASKEEATIQQAGKALAGKYALAEAQGISMARTLNQMATLPKRLKRARTEADMADFTQRLYGVDLTRAMKAAEKANQGDLNELRALNADVANHWGTQPETSEAILRSWYKGVISGI